MKLSVYAEIVAKITDVGSSIRFPSDLIAHFPLYSLNTLGSIYSQECQKKTKKSHHRHTAKIDEYYFRYCEGTQLQLPATVMLNMARQADLSPALMARLVLERHLAYSQYDGQSPPKSVVSQLLKETYKVDDARLAVEIDMCLAADDVYGPVVDVIKHCIGHEYEFLLQRLLDAYGLSYLDEKQLRTKGYDKTPDFILQVPIAIDGQVVNWIESKASFGDQESHAGYLKDQFWSYWNRFGSGLVIYWFGFIDELDVNRNKGIMLMDRFPENIIRLSVSDEFDENDVAI